MCVISLARSPRNLYIFYQTEQPRSFLKFVNLGPSLTGAALIHTFVSITLALTPAGYLNESNVSYVHLCYTCLTTLTDGI